MEILCLSLFPHSCLTVSPFFSNYYTFPAFLTAVRDVRTVTCFRVSMAWLRWWGHTKHWLAEPSTLLFYSSCYQCITAQHPRTFKVFSICLWTDPWPKAQLLPYLQRHINNFFSSLTGVLFLWCSINQRKPFWLHEDSSFYTPVSWYQAVLYWGADKVCTDLGQNLENISVYFKNFMIEKQREREKEEEKERNTSSIKFIKIIIWEKCRKGILHEKDRRHSTPRRKIQF